MKLQFLASVIIMRTPISIWATCTTSLYYYNFTRQTGTGISPGNLLFPLIGIRKFVLYYKSSTNIFQPSGFQAYKQKSITYNSWIQNIKIHFLDETNTPRRCEI